MAIEFVPGQRITAAALNAFAPDYLLQSSDQTLNTTTFTNHNTFASISVAANEIWEYSILLATGNGNTGSDLKTRLQVTSTVTTSWRHIVSVGATATVANDVTGNFQARATTDSVSHGITASTSVLCTIQEKFLVNGGASGGTFTLQWACVAASGNVTVYGGSHLVGHRLA